MNQRWSLRGRVGVFAVFLASQTAHAQNSDDRDEAELWLKAGVRKAVSKRTKISFEQHVRFDEDVSRFRRLMPELGVDYALSPYLSFASGYRLIATRRKSGAFRFAHRVNVDGQLETKWKKLRGSYRIRYQEKWSPHMTPGMWVGVLRQRATAQLRVTKAWRPFLSWEFFLPVHSVNDSLAPASWRGALGTSFRWNKKNRWQIGYALEKAWTVPERTHIFSLSYVHQF